MKWPPALVGGGAFSLFGVMNATGIEPAHIDPVRYMGKWRVLACTANPMEKRFVHASETYTLIGSDRVGVTFQWRDGSFDARIKTHHFNGSILNHPSRGIWRMKLLPFFSATYIVVNVDPEYSTAVVAHPSRNFGWFLARERNVSQERWGEVLNLFGSLQYDTSRFIRVPQE